MKRLAWVVAILGGSVLASPRIITAQEPTAPQTTEFGVAGVAWWLPGEGAWAPGVGLSLGFVPGHQEEGFSPGVEFAFSAAPHRGDDEPEILSGAVLLTTRTGRGLGNNFDTPWFFSLGFGLMRTEYQRGVLPSFGAPVGDLTVVPSRFSEESGGLFRFEIGYEIDSGGDAVLQPRLQFTRAFGNGVNRERNFLTLMFAAIWK